MDDGAQTSCRQAAGFQGSQDDNTEGSEEVEDEEDGAWKAIAGYVTKQF